MMIWETLQSDEDFDGIVQRSHDSGLPGVAIFKHSTRCGVSRFVKKGFEKGFNPDQSSMPVYYLDLLQHRPISDRITKEFGIRHESPQLLVIKNGECIYHASHYQIDATELQTRFASSH